MQNSPEPSNITVPQAALAPQHGPRPLPLFLNILLRETEGNDELRKKALLGLKRYEQAKRPAPLPTQNAIAQFGTAQLVPYGQATGRKPIVFIPSIINPPEILDLSESRSLLRYLAAAGHDVYRVDWGAPSDQDTALGLDNLIVDRLLPLLNALPDKPILVGYCLGGTLALAAQNLCSFPAIVTIAAPWQFDAFPHDRRSSIVNMWKNAQPICQKLGYMPMEMLQSGFWSIDPARTIGKYADFADFEAGSDSEKVFLAVEDWANGGPPLSYSAAQQLFEDLYENNLSGLMQWQIDQKTMALPHADIPSLSIRSASDKIVPHDSSPILRDNVTLQLGHAGMVVSARAEKQLWQPLSQWLSSHGG